MNADKGIWMSRVYECIGTYAQVLVSWPLLFVDLSITQGLYRESELHSDSDIMHEPDYFFFLTS